jgi:cell division protease FtsH
MARKSNEDSSLMDRIMGRIKGSGEGSPGKPDPSQRKVRFSIWYFIAGMLLFAWFQSYLGGQQTEKISYSDFKHWARDGKVGNLVVAPKKITGDVKDEKGPARPFETVRVEEPELVGQLEKQGIKFSGHAENKWIGAMISWLLPVRKPRPRRHLDAQVIIFRS